MAEGAISMVNEKELEKIHKGILSDMSEPLMDFLRNASFAAHNAEDSMHASFTSTANIAKKVKKGGDATCELTVNSRVRMPSEVIVRELGFAGEQLKLI